MAFEKERERKCFTFIWKLENASYCWQKKTERIESPTFVTDEMVGTKWVLELYPRGFPYADFIDIFLVRKSQASEVVIDCDFSLLAQDGTVLHLWEEKQKTIGNLGYTGSHQMASRKDVFVNRRSAFLPNDTLTLRCRIWKNDFLENVHWFARTRIHVERRSFMWNIKNFSYLVANDKLTREIRTLDTDEHLMCLELTVTGGLMCDEAIRFAIIPNYGKVKIGTFKFFLEDVSGKKVECFGDWFNCNEPVKRKEFKLFRTKQELMENKTDYLQNDLLSFRCEYAFSFGTLYQEISRVVSERTPFDKSESDQSSFNYKITLPHSKAVANNDFMSMLNEGILSDVKLRTSGKTFPAHRCVLSARSPVFKAMFSHDMRERAKDIVDIEDFHEDTVFRMLRYIYGDEIDDLEWGSVTELYEAADKYQILSLKDICSSYLKAHLCARNACEALLLADLHQDEDLKGFVQNFILRKGKDIINSEEWEQLMETNLKLAAETMRLKFKV